ncbi:MAG: hypothetical protein FJY29_12415 [Betaproteobacteria bacterium]|nr:hypothetical protein [Betaproteobacteria bacterium]
MRTTSHVAFVFVFACLTACSTYEGGVNNLAPAQPAPNNEDSKSPPSEAKPSTPAAATSFGSCNYAPQKMCLDFHSAQAAESLKASCAQGGVHSEKESCAAKAKTQGCQMSVQGLKYMTTWAYDEKSKGLVAYSCTSSDGMNAELVAP